MLILPLSEISVNTKIADLDPDQAFGQFGHLVVSDPYPRIRVLSYERTIMATAIATCSTFGCNEIRVFENVPSCFTPKEMLCERCEWWVSEVEGTISL